MSRLTKTAGAAFAAGPVFWLLLWVWQRPDLHLGWPLQVPGRFLLLGLVYPLLEETVFRGGVQGFFLQFAPGRRNWHGWTAANALTSLAFALFHLFAHAPAWALPILAPSLVFGYFRDRTGRLTLPILLHIWYNLGYFWLFG